MPECTCKIPIDVHVRAIATILYMQQNEPNSRNIVDSITGRKYDTAAI
jgi:hypothetical protein